MTTTVKIPGREPASPNPPARPPRIALVVGSGGVRGAAAIGVADALRRAGLAPELVVGCSSGALFGAAVARGWNADEALAAAMRCWSREVTEQRRWRAPLQLLLPRLAGFDADFALRDDHLIERAVRGGFEGLRIESLPVPLRIAATDAATGAPVILSHGPLVDALRASMALPVIFPPVDFGGRRLVDGVVSDPLPVAAAADAELCIVLGFEGVMPRRVDKPARLFAQVSTTLMNNLQRARLAAAREAGRRLIEIDPQFDGRIGLWQTDAMPRIVERGRAAAEARLPEILALLHRGAPRHAA